MNKKVAMEEAGQDQGLVLGANVSKLSKGTMAAAVCWDDKFTAKWKEKSDFLRRNKEILDAEYSTILEALRIADKITLNFGTLINIFFDFQKALRTIGRPSTFPEKRCWRSSVF